MVNAEKHQKLQAKFGMIPIEDKEFMDKFVESIINTANEDSKYMIDVLNGLHDELTHYYDSFSGTNAGVLRIGACQRILEIYEWVFITKNTIHYNYNALRIDSDVIKSILNECDGVLNEFKNIQAIQNKNIDNKTYGGYYGVVASELVDNVDDYPLENFESIIRLQEPINLGADGMKY